MSEPVAAPGARLESYVKRQFVASEQALIGGVTFKVYLISKPACVPDWARLRSSAIAYLEGALPSLLRKHDPPHGAGYLIVHVGEMATWLLAHWWAYGDIAMGLIASTDTPHDTFVDRGADNFHACVWEQVVISHETRAWVKHALSGRSDIEGYLADHLPDGLY